MTLTHLPALATLLALFLYFGTTWWVGRMRGRHQVKAPATTGPIEFERAFRVQQNTLEALMMFLPALWLAARYGNPTWAGVLGLVFVAARVQYAVAYAAGRNRGPGFIVGLLVIAGLTFWALAEVLVAMARGA